MRRRFALIAAALVVAAAAGAAWARSTLGADDDVEVFRQQVIEREESVSGVVHMYAEPNEGPLTTDEGRGRD